MMFAQAAPAGSRLLALSGNLVPDVNAWATRAPDGPIRVVLVNTATHARTVDVRATGQVSTATATLERLQAPSLQAQTRVTLAGQSFGAFTTTGVLSGPSTTSSLTPVAGRYVVSVPGASAALLTLPTAQASG